MSIKLTRREILPKLLLAPLALFLPSLGFANGERASRKILLNRIRVAGFQYHEGMRLRTSLMVGESLDLRAEPDNVYDHYAVALYWRGHHIGYVPRTENKHLSRLLRQDCALRGVITGAEPEAPAWETIRADIFLTEMKKGAAA